MRIADKFEHPLKGKNFTVAQNHSDYYDKYGKYHIGEDISTGPGDTDIGVRVNSAANGEVVYANWAHNSWGNVVIVHHTLANGEIISSISGHLHTISVSVGDEVKIGQQVGTIGDANGLYDAHLHYEIYKGALWSPGNGYSVTKDSNLNTEWVDPSSFIETFVSPPAKVSKKLPDLMISKAWLEDSSLRKNQDLDIRLEVKNAGAADAKKVETSFYWSADRKFDAGMDKFLGTDSHGTLDAGELDTNEHKEISYSKLAKLGSGYIFAVIDANDSIVELVGSNNISDPMYFTI